MRILIAVMGCATAGCRDTQQLSKETWVRDADKLGDFKVFMGRCNHSLLWVPDEEYLDVPDDKEHILEKTVEILKWALARGYDMILKIDNDTYLNIDELVKQDYTGYDYVGACVGNLSNLYAGTEAYSFIQGSAQWLSRKAARIVIEEAVPTRDRIMSGLMKYNGLICPYPHSEDLWIGQVLMPKIISGEIKGLDDPRYSNGPLTFHFALNKTQHSLPRWMYGLHLAKPSLTAMDIVHKEREL